MGSCVREVESGRAMNEIEVERLRELALEQQEIIEILRQAVKVIKFSSGGIDARWKTGKTIGETPIGVSSMVRVNISLMTLRSSMKPARCRCYIRLIIIHLVQRTKHRIKSSVLPAMLARVCSAKQTPAGEMKFRKRKRGCFPVT